MVSLSIEAVYISSFLFSILLNIRSLLLEHINYRYFILMIMWILFFISFVQDAKGASYILHVI